MNLKLSDNIKKYRIEMDLTQKGLADIIGVTVGAVSKWESGSNVPDILTMMDLANFFNISMDELVGYDMSSKSLEDMCRRINELSFAHKDEEAVKVANEAMSRYPHNFKVLYTCAEMYYRKAYMSHEAADAGTAIGILQSSLNCLSQNRDPDINEFTIKYMIAHMYSIFDHERALKMLREINYQNNLCNEIALMLLQLGKTTEAFENFSVALFRNFVEQEVVTINTAWAIITTGRKKDYQKALELLDAHLGFVEACSYREKLTIMDKVKLLPLIDKACLYSCLGKEKEMKACVQEARQLAEKSDKEELSMELPDFFKFYFTTMHVPVYDALGEKAVAGVDIDLQRKLDEIPKNRRKYIEKVVECWNQKSN